MLTVSIIIPVKNGAGTLPACFAALTGLTPAPTEIIFVDNASTDDTSRLLTEFQRNCRTATIRVLHQPRPGAAAARNAGIRTATGDLIAFTDADCAPHSDWLLHLTDPFADTEVGAVAGSITGTFNRSLYELFSSLYTLQSPRDSHVHRAWTPWSGGFPTANLAVRRALLDRLQGFDENVTIYGEDYDLCARLYQQGVSIVYQPAACVTHHHRTTLRGVLKQAFGFGRGHAYLLHRHRPDGLWLALPRRAIQWRGVPVHGWIDAASPDKKLAGLIGLGLVYRPLLWLIPMYLCWLAYESGTRARQAGAAVSAINALGLAWMLVLKAGAMTAGRWWGSLRYGAFCI